MTKERSKYSYLWHASIWFGGFCLLNFTGWFNTIGVFHYEDQTLLWPTFFGTIINAIIFYGNGNYLLGSFYKRFGLKKYLLVLTNSIILLNVAESFIDFIFYQSYYDKKAPVDEIIITNILLNTIFFLLPSFFYRFAKDWKPITNHNSKSIDKKISSTEEKSITLKTGGTTFQIIVANIVYIESQGNNINIHLLDHETITIRQSLTSFLGKLPAEQFIRCHKSFIVAVNKIRKMDYDFTYIEKHQLPIGRAYRQQVKEFFN